MPAVVSLRDFLPVDDFGRAGSPGMHSLASPDHTRDVLIAAHQGVMKWLRGARDGRVYRSSGQPGADAGRLPRCGAPANAMRGTRPSQAARKRRRRGLLTATAPPLAAVRSGAGLTALGSVRLAYRAQIGWRSDRRHTEA